MLADKPNNITRYQIGDLSLDIQRGELTRDGNAIALPKLSYDLLVALAHASPALLSQAELMEIVWPERVIGDETLKQRIKLLRKSLDDNATTPSYIEAVRGRGYRLIPNVTSKCVIKQPPSVTLELSPNDQFPNILGAQLSRTWQKVSTILLIVFFVVVLSSQFIPASVSDINTLQADNELSSSIEADKLSSLLESATLAQNEDVNRYYLRGREYYHRYRENDNDIAISFFKKALSIDSRYAPAYAALSQSYSQKYFQFSGSEGDRQLAIDNAYQALSYDNESALPYKALGTAYYTAGWLSKSVKTLTRGKRIDPNNTEILINLAYIYSEQGDLMPALALQKQVLEQEPEHTVVILHIGIALHRLGHLALAQKWYKRALSLQPDYLLTYYYLAQLAIEDRDFKLAKFYQEEVKHMQHSDRAQKIQALMNAEITYYQGDVAGSQKSYQVYAESSSGQLSLRAGVLSELITQTNAVDGNEGFELIAGITKLKAMQQQGNEQFEVSLLLAEIYSAMGNLTLAKRYLTQAIEQGYQLNYRVKQGPLFEPLRATAYFEKLSAEDERVALRDLDNFYLLSD